MTFLAVFGGACLLGATLGFLVARRPAVTWSSFNKILLGTLLLQLFAGVLGSAFHVNLLLLILAVATAFLLSFSFFECRRAPRYPDYPELSDM